MDAWHDTLLSAPHVEAFFDANSQRNQYLSEFALHRSLLQYEHRVRDPAHADFFYVPFYARLAYADKKANRYVRTLQRNLTTSLATCLRRSPAWRQHKGRDHFAIISSTRDPKKLFGDAWTYLKRGVTLRIEAVDNRYASSRERRRPRLHSPYEHAARRRERAPGRRLKGGHGRSRDHHDHGGLRGDGHGDGPAADASTMVIPYYVPHFAADDVRTAANAPGRPAVPRESDGSLAGRAWWRVVGRA